MKQQTNDPADRADDDRLIIVSPQPGRGSLGTLGSFPPTLGNLALMGVSQCPAPEGDASIAQGGNSDTDEDKAACVFADAVVGCLATVDLWADELRRMSEDATLLRIQRENTSQAPDLSMHSVIYSANYRLAKNIGNAIRQQFGLPAREEI
jgi:hypothetical protein